MADAGRSRAGPAGFDHIDATRDRAVHRARFAQRAIPRYALRESCGPRPRPARTRQHEDDGIN
ncbi:salicylate biosynthesis isochorismate synthase [Burkholderia oklahomensis EO147]|nr:salicylate biosynthesis isochorismate synthase [Burkholderia oklahomensis EO147]AOI49508.1 salicylate biosynthesis isochorismate synthase [Burkholderia oklahomensis C6786]KUY62210.1 salicylate biosynthesis isochorismate synthase [Burkholderia oklahomensis C6786]KUY67630.1 salicylate biosynthesis isochorismate synthase [Burkholderia oklahomensis EO147]